MKQKPGFAKFGLLENRKTNLESSVHEQMS
ncbi:hypothetical protein PEDI_39000 [Persicobacter diffluens]|uniref:Uncharacterized protein n=1 Tax=Persicobacter diffluens TaxID=981 RepID=A0AAN4W2E2_9BACT|nr:hypothetical protein PEDI_39000 [Persicobacter diffluens]